MKKIRVPVPTLLPNFETFIRTENKFIVRINYFVSFIIKNIIYGFFGLATVKKIKSLLGNLFNFKLFMGSAKKFSFYIVV